jgi:antitoxin (DNA-binding transcriptional repressor) of toxin-antitoxin stability system
MHQVKYDMPEAQSSLEYILEQVIHGTEVIILRQGIEIARITATQGPDKRSTVLMGAPYELR